MEQSIPNYPSPAHGGDGDDWSAEIVYDPDRGWMLDDVDPCPDCGEQTIINATIAFRGQFVDENDGEGSHENDTTMEAELVSAYCGNTANCGRPLIDEGTNGE